MKQLTKNQLKELEDWILRNYSPYKCGYTHLRSSGNDTDVFDDGYECGYSSAAYDVGSILDLELQIPYDPGDYNF